MSECKVLVLGAYVFAATLKSKDRVGFSWKFIAFRFWKNSNLENFPSIFSFRNGASVLFLMQYLCFGIRNISMIIIIYHGSYAENIVQIINSLKCLHFFPTIPRTEAATVFFSPLLILSSNYTINKNEMSANSIQLCWPLEIVQK